MIDGTYRTMNEERDGFLIALSRIFTTVENDELVILANRMEMLRTLEKEYACEPSGGQNTASLADEVCRLIRRTLLLWGSEVVPEFPEHYPLPGPYLVRFVLSGQVYFL
jgi:hypothetical protein